SPLRTSAGNVQGLTQLGQAVCAMATPCSITIPKVAGCATAPALQGYTGGGPVLPPNMAPKASARLPCWHSGMLNPWPSCKPSAVTSTPAARALATDGSGAGGGVLALGAAAAVAAGAVRAAAGAGWPVEASVALAPIQVLIFFITSP